MAWSMLLYGALLLATTRPGSRGEKPIALGGKAAPSGSGSATSKAPRTRQRVDAAPCANWRHARLCATSTTWGSPLPNCGFKRCNPHAANRMVPVLLLHQPGAGGGRCRPSSACARRMNSSRATSGSSRKCPEGLEADRVTGEDCFIVRCAFAEPQDLDAWWMCLPHTVRWARRSCSPVRCASASHCSRGAFEGLVCPLARTSSSQ